MIFDTLARRKKIIGVMREIAEARQPDFDRALEELLTAPEKGVQQYAQQLGFAEGAWYRPAHNVLVPAAMIAAVNRDGFARDLVIPAILHDAGNSLMKVAQTTDGADWENADKRYKHMEIGGIMLHTTLGILRSQGKIEITDERIAELKAIVDTHDFPYLGQPLTNHEARAHRGADRTFVPSALSWYKDLIAHYSDQKYLGRAKAAGFEIGPKEFLLCRMAFFYESNDALPIAWNRTKFPLDTSRVTYNEGQECEPCYGCSDKAIVDSMISSRAAELPEVLGADTATRFGDLFERVFTQEVQAVIEYAKGE